MTSKCALSILYSRIGKCQISQPDDEGGGNKIVGLERPWGLWE